jgi:predicted DNA-binding ribbon-helix-helix protein
MAQNMRKRSITIGGHSTSIALEDAFWAELEALAQGQGRSLRALVAEIDSRRTGPGNLASTLRLFVLAELKRSRS